LPVATSSVEWYQGHREHLPLARIDGNHPVQVEARVA